LSIASDSGNAIMNIESSSNASLLLSSSGTNIGHDMVLDNDGTRTLWYSTDTLGTAQVIGLTYTNENGQFNFGDGSAVGISATGIKLGISSTTAGFRSAVMTTAQRDVIGGTSIPEGVMIYNSDTNDYEFWDGTTWQSMGELGSFPLFAPTGSQEQPMYTFESYTGTGLFLSGTGAIGFTNFGVESLTLDATGNMGLNTTNPRILVDGAGGSVVPSTNATVFQIANTGSSSVALQVVRSANNSQLVLVTDDGVVDQKMFSIASDGSGRANFRVLNDDLMGGTSPLEILFENGQLLALHGTQTGPTWSFESATGAGMYYSAAEPAVGISVQHTGVAYFTATGVGIGTSTPNDFAAVPIPAGVLPLTVHNPAGAGVVAAAGAALGGFIPWTDGGPVDQKGVQMVMDSTIPDIFTIQPITDSFAANPISAPQSYGMQLSSGHSIFGGIGTINPWAKVQVGGTHGRIGLHDTTFTGPGVATMGLLYKKAGSNGIWWNATGGIGDSNEVNLADHTPSFPLLAPTGTQTYPSYTFESATGTGLYLASTGTLGISAAGTGIFFVNSTGAGVGTSTPNIIDGVTLPPGVITNTISNPSGGAIMATEGSAISAFVVRGIGGTTDEKTFSFEIDPAADVGVIKPLPDSFAGGPAGEQALYMQLSSGNVRLGSDGAGFGDGTTGPFSPWAKLQIAGPDGRIGLGDSSFTGASTGTMGLLYKKAGDNGIWWNATGGIGPSTEVNLTLGGLRYVADFVVGKTNSEYPSVQAAIDAAETASLAASGTGITVWLRPGIYDENITLPQHVSLVGIGDDSILRSAAAGVPTVTAQTGVSAVFDTYIKNLSIVATDADAVFDQGSNRIYDTVNFSVSTTATERRCLNASFVGAFTPADFRVQTSNCTFKTDGAATRSCLFAGTGAADAPFILANECDFYNEPGATSFAFKGSEPALGCIGFLYDCIVVDNGIVRLSGGSTYLINGLHSLPISTAVITEDSAVMIIENSEMHNLQANAAGSPVSTVFGSSISSLLVGNTATTTFTMINCNIKSFAGATSETDIFDPSLMRAYGTTFDGTVRSSTTVGVELNNCNLRTGFSSTGALSGLPAAAPIHSMNSCYVAETAGTVPATIELFERQTLLINNSRVVKTGGAVGPALSCAASGPIGIQILNSILLSSSTGAVTVGLGTGTLSLENSSISASNAPCISATGLAGSIVSITNSGCTSAGTMGAPGAIVMEEDVSLAAANSTISNNTGGGSLDAILLSNNSTSSIGNCTISASNICCNATGATTASVSFSFANNITNAGTTGVAAGGAGTTFLVAGNVATAGSTTVGPGTFTSLTTY
jgi:hypothetical protein